MAVWVYSRWIAWNAGVQILVKVAASARNWSLVRRSSIGCAAVCDPETSTMRRPRPELDCCAARAHSHTLTVTHECFLLLSPVQISLLGLLRWLRFFTTVFTPQNKEVSYGFLHLRASSLFTVSFDAASSSNDPTLLHFLPISCSLTVSS